MTSTTDRKDLDFLELKQQDVESETLTLADINKHLVMILKRDIFYLKSRGLIDYSLLLAIELSAEKFNPEQLVEKRLNTDLICRRQSIQMAGNARSQARLSMQLDKVSNQLMHKSRGSVGVQSTAAMRRNTTMMMK